MIAFMTIKNYFVVRFMHAGRLMASSSQASVPIDIATKDAQ